MKTTVDLKCFVHNCSSSYGIVNRFFDNLDFFTTNPSLIPDGSCMTAYAMFQTYLHESLSSLKLFDPH